MWDFIALISLLVVAVSIVALPFVKGKRKKVGALAAVGFVVAIVTIFIAGDDEAKRLGFTDATDQRAAKDAGVTDPVAWHAARDAAAEKAKAEKQATVVKRDTDEAHAASTNDEVFANAALRELHKVTIASAQSERAAKDSDRIGCHEAYDGLQKAAHEALTDLHQMSFAPIDALDRVSTLLRASNLAQSGCPDEAAIRLAPLPMLAGQAILGLRVDYAIGDADWYMANTSGEVEGKNPLRYAKSLSDLNYSWVDVRPKGMFIIGVSNWKAEMASREVGDPAIENSGNNLKIIEVDYRKNSGDDDTYLYFYRTKEDAQAAAQASKTRSESDAKAEAELKAFNAKLSPTFTSLPYFIASQDTGFKLTYAVCKPAGKDAKGQNTCHPDDSRDWSDNRAVPYRWFSNISGCEDAAARLNTEHPADVEVNPDDAFMAYCVPAPNVNGRTLKGYKMVFALTPLDAESNDNVYADLRDYGSKTASEFKTFNACYDAMDAAYFKAMKDLGADENGTLLSDNTKTIDLTATCVRVY
jgi:hypothetical protein